MLMGTSSANDALRSDSSRPTRTPENVEIVRLQNYASKHTTTLGLSYTHLDLKFDRMTVMQELIPRYFPNYLACCQRLLEVIPEIATVFLSNEAHFHLSSVSTNKTGQRLIPVNYNISANSTIVPYLFKNDNVPQYSIRLLCQQVETILTPTKRIVRFIRTVPHLTLQFKQLKLCGICFQGA